MTRAKQAYPSKSELSYVWSYGNIVLGAASVAAAEGCVRGTKVCLVLRAGRDAAFGSCYGMDGGCFIAPIRGTPKNASLPASFHRRHGPPHRPCCYPSIPPR